MSAPIWRPSADWPMLERRAWLLASIRVFMAERGVLEVDTPSAVRSPPAEPGLECIALQRDGVLAPSPEPAMKRLLAAGAPPVYQLGHVFRADETGRWHNPEFTMLEWYRPRADMAALIDETTALVSRLGGARPSGCRRYRDVFLAYAGLDPISADTKALAACAHEHGIAPVHTGALGRADWLDLIQSLVVQPRLGSQGIDCITHFPVETALLAAADPHDARLAQRFELYWQGVELANGAQELTCADTARARIQAAAAAHDAPARAVDEALLAAMQAGLPRCAGVALGVDRLLALLQGVDDIAAVMPFEWSRR